MTNEMLAAKAEFYLMMSRAFLPPTHPDSLKAFAEIFPEELGEIAREAGYAIEPELAAYIEEARKIPDQLNLLQTYGGLFLMPPREIQLHVSVYLDGAILGGSVDGLQIFYGKQGLGKSDNFRDLPDHISIVLEFLALLYAKAVEAEGNADLRAELENDAQTLNRKYLLSWVPIMRRHMTKTLNECADRGHTPLYLHLAAILQNALVADAGELTPELKNVLNPSSVVETSKEDPKDMALCRTCGAEIAPASRIRRVKKVLEKDGVDTSHLDLCPRCRSGDIYPTLPVQPKEPH